ncbi:LON peptidase substrate-binding domain-containing protein [Thalassotalea sp. LPB0316]|uniref:LON peptidase substrate-binding domain-containing protein n=1 Tax=Thalassotalea sp. LPB0316 TaxID=2769490 RepID=UPI001865FAB2|nr:LON peptidase substrate-binding domain-containing protein [Thalassotalea sp. LPB0316]QOL27027.1 LON peptidase substrate-binding domain-containing protein [Thalassotalea sp. LPB0316]
MNLPIFPLPIFLLPEGVTQLRIFEQRYLNMVKNCNKTQGFAIKYQNQALEQYADWASWVEIIDFDQDDNGMLLITVKCKQLVKINDAFQNEDLLLIGNVSEKPFWSFTPVDEDHELAINLAHLIKHNPPLEKLYPEIVLDLSWLCARWLELLPIKFDQKNTLIEPSKINRAESLITSILASAKS